MIMPSKISRIKNVMAPLGLKFLSNADPYQNPEYAQIRSFELF